MAASGFAGHLLSGLSWSFGWGSFLLDLEWSNSKGDFAAFRPISASAAFGNAIAPAAGCARHDQAAQGDVGEQALRCIRFGNQCHCS
jgi:hypothetical protein